VRFSSILLDRSPHNERELCTLYCALLAQGSDLSAAEVARMVDQVSADSVGWFMRKLEDERRLRQASDAVVRYLRTHKIASNWGEGLSASSDMTSLEGFWCKSGNTKIRAPLAHRAIFMHQVLHSRQRAQSDLEHRGVVARTAPCGCGASARCRRS